MKSPGKTDTKPLYLMEEFFISKNKCKYGKGLGNARPVFCSTVL
jgi:hypothetical protein